MQRLTSALLGTRWTTVQLLTPLSASMHSVTDKQTDRQTDDIYHANSRSY